MEPTEEEVRERLEEDYNPVGNAHLITDVREEMDRVDPSKMDEDECEAYSDVIQGLAYLQESLSEPERRPNAKVQPWGEPDD